MGLAPKRIRAPSHLKESGFGSWSNGGGTVESGGFRGGAILSGSILGLVQTQVDR